MKLHRPAFPLEEPRMISEHPRCDVRQLSIINMNIEEQKDLAQRICDLLDRVHPEKPPLLRLQLAHWLARRVMKNRDRSLGPQAQASPPQQDFVDSSGYDYDI
jgi:hypothetical protein